MQNSKFKIIAVVAIILSIFLIAAKGKDNVAPIKNNIKADDNITLVNSEKFDELAKDSRTFLLDVHTPKQTHIPGTDAFIPYNEIEKNAARLPKDKNTTILVYCRSGSMSKQASETLSSLGYSQVYDLEGGTDAYKKHRALVALTPETKELGQVIYGDIAKTAFALTNFTPEPLVVTRVSTSCGCTTAKMSVQKLGPYEEAVVNVEFNPAFHKDDTDLGELTRTIYIETDNPNFSKLQANITANVIKQ